MNRIYRNGRVRDKESRQNRYGVLYLLARLLPPQVVWLTEKPWNLSIDNDNIIILLLTVFVSRFLKGSMGKAMVLRGMLMFTEGTYINR